MDNRQRQVCHWPALIDRYFVRIFVHHPDKEVRSILCRRLCRGFSLRKFRPHKRFVPPARIPGSAESNFPIAPAAMPSLLDDFSAAGKPRPGSLVYLCGR